MRNSRRKQWDRLTNEGVFPTTIHYVFGEEDFLLEAKNAQVDTKSTIRYSSLYSFLENKDYIILFTSRDSGHGMRKSGFTSGSAEELVALFQKNGVKIR